MIKLGTQGGMRVTAQMALSVALTYQMKQVLSMGSGLKSIFQHCEKSKEALKKTVIETEYYFDEVAANRAVNFIEKTLVHVKVE